MMNLEDIRSHDGPEAFSIQVSTGKVARGFAA
jgi:hypothetical protein